MNSDRRPQRDAPRAPLAGPGEPGPRIAFDVSSLLAWYCYRAQVTGIQRIAERIMTAPAALGDPSVIFIARTEGMKSFVAVDRGAMAALGEAGSRDAAVARLRDLHARLIARQRPRRPLDRLRRGGGKPEPEAVLRQGDVVVNLVDFWTHRDHAETYLRVRDRGVRLVQFVYDIIPESHPHLCHEASIVPFRRALESIAGVADAFLVDSAHVRSEFARYLERKGLPPRPVALVPFGWAFAAAADSAADDAAVLRRHGLADGGYILQVGTLEPRKNHILVARTLQRLYGRLGARLPTTVFVGRLGWKTDPLLQELAGIDYLGGRIRVLDDVGDVELAALYRGCRFSLFPSFVEGWGLPVQESLQFGKPCLASHATSIPEAGLDLAEYIDPYDAEGFAAALERWIVDDAHIAAMGRRIAAFFAARRLPTWNDSARTVLDFVRAEAAMPEAAR